jgi:hypothetical protein
MQWNYNSRTAEREKGKRRDRYNASNPSERSYFQTKSMSIETASTPKEKHVLWYDGS